jgi:hypothetical protein
MHCATSYRELTSDLGLRDFAGQTGFPEARGILTTAKQTRQNPKHDNGEYVPSCVLKYTRYMSIAA